MREVVGVELVGEALTAAIHLHEGLAADVLLEDAATEHGAFAFALVAGIHARSHGPTVEDHGGGVLVFRGSAHSPCLDAVACASGIEAGGGAAGYSGGLQGGLIITGWPRRPWRAGCFSIDLLHTVFGFEDSACHLAIGVNKLHHLMLEQNVDLGSDKRSAMTSLRVGGT